MPQVGNGFIATQVMTDSVFVSGLYNGLGTITPSHRARIPAPFAVPAPSLNVSAAAWDVRRATYYRRSWLDPDPSVQCTAESNVTCTNAGSRVWVEQRWYAHRSLPSLLVMEVEVLDSYDADTDAFDNDGSRKYASADVGASRADSAAAAAAPYAMLRLLNCPSSDTTDLSLQSVPVGAGQPYTVMAGSTVLAETNTSGLQGVAILTSAWPDRGMLQVVGPNVTYVFLMAIRTTVETAPQDLVTSAQADFALAQRYIANSTLRALHVAAWEEGIWVSGVEIGGGRRDVAALVNSSLAALIGSMREDRPYAPAPTGLSAAGNSQTGYNG